MLGSIELLTFEFISLNILAYSRWKKNPVSDLFLDYQSDNIWKMHDL